MNCKPAGHGPARRTPPRREGGTAIVTALLAVMLAATVASALLAQQSQALTRTERATARAQLQLYMAPTIEWARAALLQQQRYSVYDGLNQPWAQGLAARPVEDALAAGVLQDEQAKWDLNNLVGADGKRREEDVAIFARLLTLLKLDPAIADAVADWIDRDDDATGPGGAENGYYTALPQPYRAANEPLKTIDEIRRVRGVDATVFQRLSPYVTALPRIDGARSKVNVNTASSTVLRAIFPGVAPEAIDDIIRLRELPIDSPANLKQLPSAAAGKYLDIRSRHFMLLASVTGSHGQVRQAVLMQLVGTERGQAASGWPHIIWIKEL